MAMFIRDAEITDMDDLQGLFQRASLSNQHDRGLLLEHPEWLVLSKEGVLEGRMRVPWTTMARSLALPHT